jgi:PTH1 family peptidyl-tRNA hydrolase
VPFRRIFGRHVAPAAKSGPGPRFAADWLVVGLGNPGEQYARTRHNVGFWVVNELAKRAGTQPKSVGSLMHIGVGTLADVRVALVKPKTYVNLSGRAVTQAHQWTGCDATHTIVLYDELDLPVGALRVRAGGGHGGHNGVRSLLADLGDASFARVRVGIGRPTPGHDPANYLLSNFSRAEAKELPDLIGAAADAVETILRSGLTTAMNKFNVKSNKDTKD